MNRRLPVWRLGFIAALVALLLRALVPPGYMPMVSPGHISIGFCPGGELTYGHASMPGMSMDAMPGMDMGMDQNHGHGGPHYVECDFSVALTGVPPPVLPALPALPEPAPLPVPARLGGIARLAAVTLPPVRGPPLFS